jgi:hypothetical protein
MHFLATTIKSLKKIFLNVWSGQTRVLMHFQTTNTGFSFYLFLKEKRHFWWKRGTFDGVQSFWNKKETQLCQPRDTFFGKEIFFEEKRHKCAKKRDTSVGIETLLEEHRHLCRRRDNLLWK